MLFSMLFEVKQYKTNGFLSFVNSSIIKPMVFLFFCVGPGTRGPGAGWLAYTVSEQSISTQYQYQ